jgi:transposase
MLFVSLLNNVEKITLREMSKNHLLPWTRIRASAVLMSAERIPLQKIACIYDVQRQTVSIGLKNWENKGICGLLDKLGRGRPRKTASKKDKEITAFIKKCVDRNRKFFGNKIKQINLEENR